MQKTLYFMAFAVIVLLVGCGKDSKSNFDEAKKLKSEKRYNEAIAIFEKMIADMPDDDSIVVAYYHLGELYRMPEIAKSSKDKLKAIENYKKVYEKFPKNDLASQALFQIGFIYGNELDDIPNATEYYNKVIKEYPKTEAAKLAQDDLQLLGKSPEELLNERMKKNENNKKENKVATP